MTSKAYISCRGENDGRRPPQPGARVQTAARTDPGAAGRGDRREPADRGGDRGGRLSTVGVSRAAAGGGARGQRRGAVRHRGPAGGRTRRNRGMSESRFMRWAAVVADFGSPVYREERQRDVWNEA